MIKMIMGTVSGVCMTLTEETDFNNFENWIFELRFKETGEFRTMILEPQDDISFNDLRFNEFLIEEGVDINLEEGQWDYRVYQTGLTAGNPDILNPDVYRMNRLVEIGRLNVVSE
jgi:hypothetical protein